jgi:hypothetical protein
MTLHEVTGRLRAHVSEPLSLSAHSLMAKTVITAGLAILVSASASRPSDADSGYLARIVIFLKSGVVGEAT